MNTLFFQHFLSFTNALLVSLPQGAGSVLLLFLLCFTGVHIAKIAIRGWRLYDGETTATADPQPPATPKKEEKPPEAVYYIVEKKRRRSKPSYGDPKEFRFK